MAARPPNVLLFFADDQRFDTIRALGNPDIHTPNLDWLVRAGTAFTRAYIMGGTVAAVCMPSRAMLMTGRTLFHLQDSGETIPEQHVMLPELLRGAGYDTFGTGKWHNGPASYARCFSHGDQIFFGGMDDHWNVPVCRFDPTGAYPEPRPHPFDPGTGTVEMQGKRFDAVASGTHSSELFADATIEFLLGRAGSGARARAGGDGCPPFFAYLSFMAPHDPRTMPQRFLTMYDPERMPLPDAFLPEHPFDIGWRGRDELLERYPRTPAAIRRHIAEYYAMISHLDAEMGRVIDALRSTGELDNTIIVFAGDNGLALGQHGLMGKQSTYEHSVHVPLLMAGPGIASGARREALCYLLDIYPTLCDMLGVAAPASVEGRSLRPALADPDAAVRDRLHFAYQDLHRAVTDGRYKLIEWVVDGERHTQLFDHAADPRELHDVAGLPEQGDNLRRLQGELRELRERWDDPADNVWQVLEQGS